MSYDPQAAVQVVQDNILNLLDLVDQAARSDGAEDAGALAAEARSTVLRMLAAIVLSDRKYTVGEQAFIQSLLDVTDKPGGEMAYLNEYAEAWKTSGFTVPRFFQVAVRHDARHQTQLARAMLREIQLLGNNSSITDGSFGLVEHETVHNYILFLEEFLMAWKPPQQNATISGWSQV
jgi:hypothetical protein